MLAEGLRTACAHETHGSSGGDGAVAQQAAQQRRKGVLGCASLGSLAACLAGFVPALALFIERGRWRLDPFYGADRPEPLDRWVLGWHAPLGFVWLAIASLQVSIGAGFLPWKKLHRYMGYRVVPPLVVVLLALGVRKELDSIGVITMFHLSIVAMALINLGFAIRAGMNQRYRDHAEFASYSVAYVNYPGCARLVGFVSEFFVPCSLTGFLGYEFVLNMLIAVALPLAMYLRGGPKHERAFAANMSFIVLYGVGQLVYSLHLGVFLQCRRPEEQVWRWAS